MTSEQLRAVWALGRGRLSALAPVLGVDHASDPTRMSAVLERIGFTRSAEGRRARSGFVRGPCPRCLVIRGRGQMVDGRWICGKCARLEDAAPMAVDVAAERAAYRARIEEDPGRLVGIRGRSPDARMVFRSGTRAGRAN